MKRGLWHQCGDKSQKLVLEQLRAGNGVGVVLSPRDVTFPNQMSYSDRYKEFGAEILIDLQFYNPSFTNPNLASYPINTYRLAPVELAKNVKINSADIAKRLETITRNLGCSAILAPALVYEAADNYVIDLNSQLFSIAKIVGDNLGLPTYSSILLGRSVVNSQEEIMNILSTATSLDSEGIYFGIEFRTDRIPNSKDDIKKLATSLLELACTGKQVLHAFAGPSSLLSFGFGATGAAIGHSHNLWQFTRERWEPSTANGGGGDAPARYFSKELWGTFVYPDEFFDDRLGQDVRRRLLNPSPFFPTQDTAIQVPFDRWTANKHFLFTVGSEVERIASKVDAVSCSAEAYELLRQAVQMGQEIAQTGIELKDDTCCYQQNWVSAIEELQAAQGNSYAYLQLLAPTA